MEGKKIMGDFLSSAAFRTGSSSLRRPAAQIEQRQTEEGSLTTEQPRGELGSHGIQEVHPETTTAGASTTPGVSAAALSQQEQMRKARLEALSKRQQPVQELETPVINHGVAQVSPPKQKDQGFLSALSSAATSLAQAVGLVERPLTEAEKAEQQTKVRNTRIEKFSQPSTPALQEK